MKIKTFEELKKLDGKMVVCTLMKYFNEPQHGVPCLVKVTKSGVVHLLNNSVSGSNEKADWDYMYSYLIRPTTFEVAVDNVFLLEAGMVIDLMYTFDSTSAFKPLGRYLYINPDLAYNVEGSTHTGISGRQKVTKIYMPRRTTFEAVKEQGNLVVVYELPEQPKPTDTKALVEELMSLNDGMVAILDKVDTKLKELK